MNSKWQSIKTYSLVVGLILALIFALLPTYLLLMVIKLTALITKRARLKIILRSYNYLHQWCFGIIQKLMKLKPHLFG